MRLQNAISVPVATRRSPLRNSAWNLRPRTTSSCSGAALLIVLAFVVMLFGLLVAFLSESTLQQQVSKSSSSLASVDVFANGAATSIIGDIKEEIAAGSMITNVVAAGITNTIYLPSNNLTATPAISGFATNAGLENLLKVSMGGSNFFPVSYPTASSYPPANRASTVSTTNLSYNSRSFSALRWNRPLLIARQNLSSTTDFTPINSFSNAIPQWIYVTRSGANPTSWSNNMIWSQTNPSTVIGRYAYAIYNEGGLLDANVAGYPQVLTNNATSKLLPVYKGGEYFADLTQIGLTTNQITALVGWRNNVSSVASGTYPSYTWTDNGSRYASNVLGNTNGFLKVATNSFGTDRQFTSRQQLIAFLQNADPGGLTNALNALQYLTHFSRGLNQPSLVPATTFNSNAPSIRPWTTNSDGGGNNAYGGDTNTLILNNGAGVVSADKRINPTFLWVLAQTNFTRNDGKVAIPGEPLVKTRFNLNCLSWITYQGPSANRNISSPSAIGSDSDIFNLINTYGISTNWLALGTASNISKYFGLSWNNGIWTYNHGSNSIQTLNQVASLTGTNSREPDFFELLKASINAGALGKTGCDSTTRTNPYGPQVATDASLDYQILKIGVNIIDQATVDGYPTTISWPNNGGNTTNFVGIKNLPYVSMMSSMAICARSPKPYAAYQGLSYFTWNDYTTNGGASYPNKLTDTGVSILLWYPQVWNPNDWNSNNLNQTFGTPAPSNFQIYILPIVSGTLSIKPQPKIFYNTYTNSPHGLYPDDPNANISLSPNFPSTLNGGKSSGFSFSLPVITPTFSNTVMTFSIPNTASGAALFREPTFLFKPGIPTGSSLAAPGLATFSNNIIPASYWSSDGGIMRDNTDNTLTNASLPDPLSQGYIGFFAGASPIRWIESSMTLSTNSKVYTNGPAGVIGTNNVNAVNLITPMPDNLNGSVMPPNVILQYKDPSNNWVTYDSKNFDTPGYSLNVGTTMSATNTNNSCWFFGSGNNNMVFPFDPRTDRFSPSTTSENPIAWIDQTNAVCLGIRSAASNNLWVGSGYVWDAYQNNNHVGATWMLPNAGGWYPGNFGNSPSGFYARPGTFEQNSTTCSNDNYFFTNASLNSTGVTYYSDADGVVRRASGAWVSGGMVSGTNHPSTNSIGIMTSVANTNNAGVLVRTSQSDSRPIILNRPFRSVAELGYVFSGTPFKNLDFFTPESGFAGLLDTFCVNGTDDPSTLVAGKVDLNTQQTNVICALLSGAYRDEWNASATTISSAVVNQIALALVNRTTSTNTGKGPLLNLSELVGKWVTGIAAGTITATNTPPYDPTSYDGFSADLSSILATNSSDLNIQRLREAPIRALASSGQTRVWNLLIDLVAQTGRFPQQANSLNQFTVEGEKRLWIHVAIDRLTGRVIDQQIEEVQE